MSKHQQRRPEDGVIVEPIDTKSEIEDFIPWETIRSRVSADHARLLMEYDRMSNQQYVNACWRRLENELPAPAVIFKELLEYCASIGPRLLEWLSNIGAPCDDEFVGCVRRDIRAILAHDRREWLSELPLRMPVEKKQEYRMILQQAATRGAEECLQLLRLAAIKHQLSAQQNNGRAAFTNAHGFLISDDFQTFRKGDQVFHFTAAQGAVLKVLVQADGVDLYYKTIFQKASVMSAEGKRMNHVFRNQKREFNAVVECVKPGFYRLRRD